MLNKKRFNDLPKFFKGAYFAGASRRSFCWRRRKAQARMTSMFAVFFSTVSTLEEFALIRRSCETELRNALYPGTLNKLLIELARSSPFTTAWNIPPYTPGEETEPPEQLSNNPLFASLADATITALINDPRTDHDTHPGPQPATGTAVWTELAAPVGGAEGTRATFPDRLLRPVRQSATKACSAGR